MAQDFALETDRGGVSKDRLLAWLLVLRLVALRTVCSSIRHLRLSRCTSAKDHSLGGQNNLSQRRFFPKWTISRLTGDVPERAISLGRFRRLSGLDNPLSVKVVPNV
jgi:hypothetical protein